MFKKITSCAAAALVLALSQGAYATNLVSDGTFAEGANAGSFQTVGAGQQIGAWTVTGNSVDLIGSYFAKTPGGSYTVDLDGNGAGGITQTLTLAAGTYELSFYLGANTDGGPAVKGVTVDAGDTTQNFLYDTKTTSGYVLETVWFTVTGNDPTVLSIASTDAANNPWGGVVGDVSVTLVPEPGSTALLLAGLGMIGLMSSRRRRN